MYNWRKDIVQWTIENILYLSIVFTWDLPRAKEIAINSKKKVIAGGPAVYLMPDYLADIAEIQHETIYPVLEFHNPLATYTTQGCPNQCSFCAVPKIEGKFRELKRWPIRPLICDNNLLAASEIHFDMVIHSLKILPFVDFQGLEAKLFTPYHAHKFTELNHVKLSFGFDSIYQESAVIDAIKLAQKHNLNDIRIYVLIGFEDNPNDAIYRLELVRSLGVLPFPQRFQPLYALEKNSYVALGWTELELRRLSRYYSRLNFLGHIPFVDYNPDDFELEKQEMMF